MSFFRASASMMEATSTLIHRSGSDILGVREAIDDLTGLTVTAFPMTMVRDIIPARAMMTAAYVLSGVLSNRRRIYLGESSRIGRRLYGISGNPGNDMARTTSSLSAVESTELERLLLCMAGENEPAFEKLYAATRRKLFATVLPVVRRRHLAEEIVQEAYVRIWLNASAYRPALGSPMLWMITIARNLAIDAARRPSREIYRDHSVLLEFPADAPTALESMESRESESDTARLQQSMLSALQTLDPARRHLVIAAYIHGESRDRLAEQYDVPVNTIKTWLRRALLQVREQIKALPPGDHHAGALVPAPGH